MAERSRKRNPDPPEDDEDQDPPETGEDQDDDEGRSDEGPVTLAQVRALVEEIVGRRGGAGRGRQDPGADVAAQVRAELEKMGQETRRRTSAKTAAARMDALEQQLAELLAGTPAEKTAGGKVDKQPESSPQQAMRRLTRWLWGGDEERTQ